MVERLTLRRAVGHLDNLALRALTSQHPVLRTADRLIPRLVQTRLAGLSEQLLRGTIFLADATEDASPSGAAPAGGGGVVLSPAPKAPAPRKVDDKKPISGRFVAASAVLGLIATPVLTIPLLVFVLPVGASTLAIVGLGLLLGQSLTLGYLGKKLLERRAVKAAAPELPAEMAAPAGAAAVKSFTVEKRVFIVDDPAELPAEGLTARVYRVHEEGVKAPPPLALKEFYPHPEALQNLEQTKGRKARDTFYGDVRSRFGDEIKISDSLRGVSHIVQIRASQQEGNLVFVMDYFPQTLRGYLTERPNALSHHEAAEIMLQICDGLDRALKSKGKVIHRDLKPSNIFIRFIAGTLEVAVGDFGSGKPLDLESTIAQSLDHLSRSGCAVGTPSYISYEVIEKGGSENLTGPTADIFSLGLIFYELLNQQLPFPPQPLTNEGAAAMRDYIWNRIQLANKAPAPLAEIIGKMLRGEYADYKPLIADLTAFQTGKAGEAAKAAPAEEATVAGRPPAVAFRESTPEERAAAEGVEVLEIEKTGTFSSATSTGEGEGWFPGVDEHPPVVLPDGSATPPAGREPSVIEVIELMTEHTLLPDGREPAPETQPLTSRYLEKVRDGLRAIIQPAFKPAVEEIPQIIKLINEIKTRHPTLQVEGEDLAPLSRQAMNKLAAMLTRKGGEQNG